MGEGRAGVEGARRIGKVKYGEHTQEALSNSFPEPRSRFDLCTVAWEIFREKRFPSLKNHAARINRYKTHIGPVFGNVPQSKITSFQLESSKADLLITEAVHRAKDDKHSLWGTLLHRVRSTIS